MAVDPTKAQLLGTNTSGTFAGYLPPEMSAPIFEEATKSSVAMQLIPQVPLGPQGKAIPMFTGTPTAEWVAEAGAKPLVTGGVGIKTMNSHKIAAIFVVSAEVVRADPGGFMGNMRKKLGESFGLAFDRAFFHGQGSGSSTSPFGAGNNLDATTKSVELGSATQAQGGIYGDVVNTLKLLVDDGKKLKSWALDTAIEPYLLTSFDANGRPMFVESTYTGTAPTVRGGTLLGRPVSMSDGIKGSTTTLGYAGDFSQAIWGVVGGITYDVTDQATLPIGDSGSMVSLWQHNMLAVRAEAEYGYLINDLGAFAKIVDAVDEGA
ncbi:phage major capsid protein [Streptomyces malaysiensis]